MVDKSEQEPEKKTEDVQVDNVSNESDDETLQIDPALIARQKRLSIPRVCIAQIVDDDEDEDGGERELLNVEGDKLHEVEDSPLLIGMMTQGGEKRMVKRAMHSPSNREKNEEAKKEKKE